MNGEFKGLLRKTGAWLTAAALLLGCAGGAFAEGADAPAEGAEAIATAGETPAAGGFEGELLLTGVVAFRQEDVIQAPVSGDLEAFDWRAGDTVQAGETAFAVAPRTVYAGMNGTVGEVFAAPGDDASAVQARYGALMSVVYERPLIVSASAATGYDTHENKRVLPGETLYLRSRESLRYAGEGRVVSVSGMNYTVEIVSGNLRFNESVNLYRSAQYDDTTRVGRGSVSAVDAYAATASGTVLSIEKARGDAVRKGDALLTYVPDALAPDEYRGAETTRVAADAERVFTQVSAANGASVQKGQTLAAWARKDALRLEATVGEADVGRLRAGMRAEITFENLSGVKAPGVVAGVSAIGSGAEESEFAVYIDFEAAAGVLCGMHATALFTESGV